jgi:hypothetical protein
VRQLTGIQFATARVRGACSRQNRAPGQRHGQAERALPEEEAERWAAYGTTVATTWLMGSRRHDASVNSVEALAARRIIFTVNVQNEDMDEYAVQARGSSIADVAHAAAGKPGIGTRLLPGDHWRLLQLGLAPEAPSSSSPCCRSHVLVSSPKGKPQPASCTRSLNNNCRP